MVNAHMRVEDPEYKTIVEHHQIISKDNNFINYIWHSENKNQKLHDDVLAE
jgi:hypothetical protein